MIRSITADFDAKTQKEAFVAHAHKDFNFEQMVECVKVR